MRIWNCKMTNMAWEFGIVKWQYGILTEYIKAYWICIQTWHAFLEFETEYYYAYCNTNMTWQYQSLTEYF